jgi:L-cysteine desulfidase
MSGIFDIIPLIISGLSLLSGLKDEGLNRRSGQHILRNVEDIIKKLSPYQQELLHKKLEILERR